MNTNSVFDPCARRMSMCLSLLGGLLFLTITPPLFAQNVREERLQALQADAKKAVIKYQGLQTQYDRNQERYKAGLTTGADLDTTRTELKTSEIELQEANRRLDSFQRASLLYHPVDINLKEATIQQAADALAKAGAIPIRVDKAVPADLRISVGARGVPFGTILETLASQAQLMIAPDGKGMVLKSWPTLDVNGMTKVFTGPNAPWSDEWGGRNYGSGIGGGGGLGGGVFNIEPLWLSLPGVTGEQQTSLTLNNTFGGGGRGGGGGATGIGLGGGGLGGTLGGGSGGLGGGSLTTTGRTGQGNKSTSPLGTGLGGRGGGLSGTGTTLGGGGRSGGGLGGTLGTSSFGGGGFGGGTLGSLGGTVNMGAGSAHPFSIAQYSDKSFIIAEPGVQNGKAGLWLTIYMPSNDKLVQAGRTFHPWADGATVNSSRGGGRATGRGR